MNTLFYNAKVYVDPGDYREAVLVRDGRIEAVGSNAEVAELADKLPSADTERIDCGGRTLIPGLNDAHLHLLQLGETLRQADLTGVRSIDEMVARCRKFLDEHPEEAAGGLHASGWNQDLFEDDQRVPDRHDLDRISTEIPVFLERVCGHMAVANSCLVEQVDFTSPELKDGEWQVGTDGRPNGVFTESACNLVKKLLPERSPEQQKELLLEAMRHAASLGITSVQTNDLGTVTHDYAAGFRMLHEIYDEDLAPVRYRHQVSFDSLEDFRAFLQG
ncbi:MAG: amidohydrolase family protein, partial [Mogibacterium sp.]|nr:amidohydrolase family protein [Mogibacterium sp.]